MMENKMILATPSGPEIQMDNSGNVFIRGKSMMEDASIFYQPCHSWIKEYLQNTQTPLLIEIELSYFNSSSAKQLMKILMEVDESDRANKVLWIYPKENDVLLERGEELEIMLDLLFEYHPK